MKPAHGLRDPRVRTVLSHYWRIAEVRPWHLVLPLFLAVLVGVVEGVSLSVLFPLGDGVLAGGFSALAENRWFGWVTRILPPSVLASPEGDAYVALLLVGLLFGGRFLKLGLEYLRLHFLAGRDERYLRLVRDETFARILGFGRQYFDRQALGHVDTELSWSASAVRVLGAVEGLIMNAFRLTLKIVLAMAISLPLFAGLLVALFLIERSLRRVARSASALADDAAKIEKRVRREVLELLTTIPLVKAYNQEANARAAHRAILVDSEHVETRRRRLVHLNYPLEEGIVLLCVLVAEAFVLAFSSGSAAASLVGFCAFFLVAQQCLPDVKAITGFRLELADQVPQLRAVSGLFEDEEKFIVPSGDLEFTGLRRGVEVRDLAFRYRPEVDVLRGVDATFPAGKVTALVGPSGAGKTSLVDLIARLYDCPPGTIFLDGTDIRAFSLSSIHRKLALVSQDVWLLNRSLRDNLTFGIDESIADATLMEVLADVGLASFFEAQPGGLDTELGDHGVRLSGGQRQRVALARSLLRDPEILILDEATSALDSAMERQVLSAIEHRRRGRTMIVIAHRLSTVKDADNILVMADGRIVESGTWADLLESDGPFRGLHAAQFSRGTERTLLHQA